MGWVMVMFDPLMAICLFPYDFGSLPEAAVLRISMTNFVDNFLARNAPFLIIYIPALTSTHGSESAPIHQDNKFLFLK